MSNPGWFINIQLFMIMACGRCKILENDDVMGTMGNKRQVWELRQYGKECLERKPNCEWHLNISDYCRLFFLIDKVLRLRIINSSNLKLKFNHKKTLHRRLLNIFKTSSTLWDQSPQNLWLSLLLSKKYSKKGPIKSTVTKNFQNFRCCGTSQ